MSDVRFEWDEKKNSLNKRKHGLSFREAQTVFTDKNCLLIDDPDHSENEDRFSSSWSEQQQYWKRW